MKLSRFSMFVLLTMAMLILVAVMTTATVFATRFYTQILEDADRINLSQAHHIDSLFATHVDNFRLKAYRLLSNGDIQSVLMGPKEWRWSSIVRRASENLINATMGERAMQSIMLFAPDRKRLIYQVGSPTFSDEAFDSLYDKLLDSSNKTRVAIGLYPMYPTLADMAILTVIQRMSGQAEGVAINLYANRLAEDTLPKEIGSDMDYMVIDLAGNILINYPSMASGIAYAQAQGVFDAMRLGSTEGAFQITSGGVPQSITYVHNNRLGYVVVIVHKMDVMMLLLSAIRYPLIIIGCVLAGLILLALLFTRRITTPVNALSRNIYGFANEEYSPKANILAVTGVADRLFREMRDAQSQFLARRWVYALTNEEGEAGFDYDGLFPEPLRSRFAAEHCVIHVLLSANYEAVDFTVYAQELFVNLIGSAAKEALGDKVFCRALSLNRYRYALIVRGMVDGPALSDVNWIELAAGTQRILASATNAVATIAISDLSQAVGDYAAQYRSVSRLMEKRLFTGNGAVISADGTPEKTDYQAIKAIGDALIEHVRSGEPSRIATEIRSLIDALIIYPLNDAIRLFVEILVDVDRTGSELLGDQREGMTVYAMHVNAIGRLEERSELEKYAETVCTEALTALVEARSMNVTRLIKDAFAFIDAHFADPDLSVQSMAARFGISVSHFSKTFNAEAGLTFPAYVNNKRLAASHEMLLNDAHTDIVHIAQKVGFHSTSYFSAQFKKRYGVSPMQVRKLNYKRL